MRFVVLCQECMKLRDHGTELRATRGLDLRCHVCNQSIAVGDRWAWGSPDYAVPAPSGRPANVRQLTETLPPFRLFLARVLERALRESLVGNALIDFVDCYLRDVDYEGPELAWVCRLSEEFYQCAEAGGQLDVPWGRYPIDVGYIAARVADGLVDHGLVTITSHAGYLATTSTLAKAITQELYPAAKEEPAHA